jgi:hypothetical protein
MLNVHDVSPGRKVDAERVFSAVNQAVTLVGNRPPVDAHYDSDGGLVAGDGAIEAYRADCDQHIVAELRRRRWSPGPRVQQFRRNDAFGIGAGGYPSDFEFVRSQLITEQRQPLTAEMLFAIDNSVPLGARTHSARRLLGAGEAQIYSGGNELPRASNSVIREQFGIAYVVCSVEQNFFEALTTDFAGLQMFRQDLALAYRLVDERINRIYWYGDAGAGLYGVLNYPGIAKMVIATPLTDATDVADEVAAIADFTNLPMVTSVGTFFGDTLAVSPRVYARMYSPRFTNGAPGLTIAQMLLNSSGGRLRSIEVAPELAGVGPNGEDAILIYRREAETLALVQVQATTQMPVFQSTPFDQTTVVFGATGGVTSFQSGNVLIGYVTVQ